MKLVSFLISVLFYGVICAILSLPFTVVLFDLPAKQVLGWAIMAAIWGGVAGALLDRRRKDSLWMFLIDGVFTAL